MNALIKSVPPHATALARWTLSSFLLTFLLSRLVVLLIMSRRMPDLFLFVGQTHVHHLNYGIFLLVFVAGWLMFTPPENRGKRIAAILYGIGLGLTFDEFGMWLHLGGSYWQRSSYDAIVIVALVLSLIAFGASAKRFTFREWMWALVIGIALLFFGFLTVERLQNLSPKLHELEESFPH
jgi:general stress protein CsbA